MRANANLKKIQNEIRLGIMNDNLKTIDGTKNSDKLLEQDKSNL